MDEMDNGFDSGLGSFESFRARSNTWPCHRAEVPEGVRNGEQDCSPEPVDDPSSIGPGGHSPSGGINSSIKKNTSRRNAWGNMSYADLITQAIQGSPEKRLTLSQIYEWMVQNVPYFKDKGDSNSSAGWKVSSGPI